MKMADKCSKNTRCKLWFRLFVVCKFQVTQS